MRKEGEPILRGLSELATASAGYCLNPQKFLRIQMKCISGPCIQAGGEENEKGRNIYLSVLSFPPPPPTPGIGLPDGMFNPQHFWFACACSSGILSSGSYEKSWGGARDRSTYTCVKPI